MKKKQNGGKYNITKLYSMKIQNHIKGGLENQFKHIKTSHLSGLKSYHHHVFLTSLTNAVKLTR